MQIKINFENLKDLNPKHLSNLKDFFSQQDRLGIKEWHKDQVYYFKDNTEFFFSHHVMSRLRKKSKPGLRFEAINFDLRKGKGAFGAVYQIMRTLGFEESFENGYRSRNKNRVVKKQEHSPDKPLEKAQRENRLTQQAKELHVKPLTVVNNGNTSLMVMSEAQGVDLLEIINQDFRKKCLTNEQRITLSRLLMLSLKRLQDRGLVHLDLKMENVRVKLGPPMKVTFLDYGFCINENEHCHWEASGTFVYNSPEQFSRNLDLNDVHPDYKYGLDRKSDNYSLGRILAAIWHVDIKATLYNPEEKKAGNHVRLTTEQLLADIFNDIPDLEDRDKEAIKKTLEGLLKPFKKDRLSIEEALKIFPPMPVPDEVTQACNHYIQCIERHRDRLDFFSTKDDKVYRAVEYYKAYWKLMEKIKEEQAKVSPKPSNIEALVTNFLTKTTVQFCNKDINLSGTRKAVNAAFLFVGAVLGAVVGAVVGAFVGIAIGAAFGNLVGAITLGTAGAVEGALTFAGLGAAVAIGVSAHLLRKARSPELKFAGQQWIDLTEMSITEEVNRIKEAKPEIQAVEISAPSGIRP